VRLFGDSVRWVPEVGWYWFGGTHWHRDDDGQLVRWAKEVPEAIIRALGDMRADARGKAFSFAVKSEQAPRLGAMIELAKSESGITLPYRKLDADPWLAGADGGAIDLRTGTHVLAPSTAYLTRQLGAAYRPHAKCRTWLAFLDRIMAGDIELIGFLQRAIGYTLTGITREQCLFLLHGSGANGKSVLLRVIRLLAGDYGADAAADTFLDRGRRESSNDLARLAQIRFVAASELDEGKHLAEALIKAVTGGEAISARFLYREHFEFTPAFKVWLACNHKPRISGDDNGIWRRIRLVPFRVTIPPAQQDQGLLEKLRLELPGILNWAIAGALAWQEVGLCPPESVTAATQAYRAESDAIGEWLQERCSVRPDASIQAKVLYDDYATFIGDRGGKALSMRRWAQRMADRGFEKDEGRLVYYLGVTLCDVRESRDQFSGTLSYSHTRGELPKEGRKGRDSRGDEYRRATDGQ
jgi:putative DNA primase/helicase